MGSYHVANIEWHDVLRGQADCLRELLAFSEKWVDKIESLPINMLREIIDHRAKWIQKIRSFMELRKQRVFDPPDKESAVLLKEISDIAEKLTEIDNQIMSKLKDRKTQYLQLISENAALRKQTAKSLYQAGQNRKRVDIYQE